MNDPPVVLVVHDVEEVRDLIEVLLRTDGFRLCSGRNEADALEKASRQRPDLILISLGGTTQDMIEAARRIRSAARPSLEVPVVIFGVDTIPEGAESAIEEAVYLVRPDNFDQLRALVRRLVSRST